MKKKKAPRINDLVNERKALGLNQSDYWERYGVTQSGGSRYETGRPMPRPLAILMRLHKAGKISDKDLASVQ
jgi:predicted transcriptional regulator